MDLEVSHEFQSTGVCELSLTTLIYDATVHLGHGKRAIKHYRYMYGSFHVISSNFTKVCVHSDSDLADLVILRYISQI